MLKNQWISKKQNLPDPDVLQARYGYHKTHIQLPNESQVEKIYTYIYTNYQLINKYINEQIIKIEKRLKIPVYPHS